MLGRPCFSSSMTWNWSWTSRTRSRAWTSAGRSQKGRWPRSRQTSVSSTHILGRKPMLRVDQVVSGYGPIDVLNHVTINLEKGEIVAVLGANGAGKTTLLRTITGLIRVRKGSVTFGDKVLNGLSPAEVVRCGISHVPEGRHIFPDLTVEENLLLAAYIMSRSQQKSRLDAMYAMFSILAKRRRQAGGTLSGGEQQMLALARGLMPVTRTYARSASSRDRLAFCSTSRMETPDSRRWASVSNTVPMILGARPKDLSLIH